MVNLYRHFCIVGGSSETQSHLPPNRSEECIVNMSNCSIRKLCHCGIVLQDAIQVTTTFTVVGLSNLLSRTV